MQWSSSQRSRIALEQSITARELPDFYFYNLAQDTYIQGWQRTSVGNYYSLRVDLPPWYPDAKPSLYVTSPNPLWKLGWPNTVNALGSSHPFHTLSNGPGGCVQICHSPDWDASKTCVGVLMKGILWLNCLEAHRATGHEIDFFATNPDELERWLTYRTISSTSFPR